MDLSQCVLWSTSAPCTWKHSQNFSLYSFFTEYILSCHRRKSPGVTSNIMALLHSGRPVTQASMGYVELHPLFIHSFSANYQSLCIGSSKLSKKVQTSLSTAIFSCSPWGYWGIPRPGEIYKPSRMSESTTRVSRHLLKQLKLGRGGVQQASSSHA